MMRWIPFVTTVLVAAHAPPAGAGPLNLSTEDPLRGVEVRYVSSSAPASSEASVRGLVSTPLFVCDDGHGGTVQVLALRGAELLFRLQSEEGVYYSGPGSRNPDGQQHAMASPVPGGLRLSWEDGSDGYDFDDCVFDVLGPVRLGADQTVRTD